VNNKFINTLNYDHPIKMGGGELLHLNYLQLNSDFEKIEFINQLFNAVRVYLDDTTPIENAYIFLENAAYTFSIVDNEELIHTEATQIQELHTQCLQFFADKKEQKKYWDEYGFLLQIIRLCGFNDQYFWSQQFDIWNKRLSETDDRIELVAVRRALRQAISGLDVNLSTPHVQSFFNQALRSPVLPSAEMLLLLEIIYADYYPKPDESMAKNLVLNIIKLLDIASNGFKSAGGAISSQSEIELNQNLQIWQKETLKLKLTYSTKPYVCDGSAARKQWASSFGRDQNQFQNEQFNIAIA
jgi:hypothetical protein